MKKLNNQKKFFIIFIIALVLVISYLHYSTLPGIHELHNIFTELYYLPLLLGALAFGLKGAIVTFIFIFLAYTPYNVLNWTSTYSFIANKVLHALFSLFFAVLAGILVDREKRRNDEAEKDRYLVGLGRAAAAIVHDLKNPIISILGFSRRIKERKGDIEAASQVVFDSALNMQKIVHDVLDFAKPVKLDVREDNIVTIIRRACNACKTKANEENVALSIDLPVEPVQILIDGPYLERALTNLINNAVEASNKRGMTEVSAKTGGDIFSIKIKDCGSGMDRETLENVFIPFYTKKSSGTGLGMAIAKKIIEGHKGKIIINSQKQMGTEITVELPL